MSTVAGLGAKGWSLNVAEAIELLEHLPEGTEVEVTLRLLEGPSRPMTAAERARAYRKRKGSIVTKRDGLRDGGVGGDLFNGSEKRAEKKEETGSNLTGSTEGDRHEASRKNVTVTERDDVKFVFEAWKRDTGHARAFLDRKRGNRILARLREGKSKEDLVQAIANRRLDPFLMGTSKGSEGKVYDGIETLLRDAGQVERLMSLGGGAASGPAPTEEQRERWRKRREELDRLEARNAAQ